MVILRALGRGGRGGGKRHERRTARREEVSMSLIAEFPPDAALKLAGKPLRCCLYAYLQNKTNDGDQKTCEYFRTRWLPHLSGFLHAPRDFTNTPLLGEFSLQDCSPTRLLPLDQKRRNNEERVGKSRPSRCIHPPDRIERIAIAWGDQSSLGGGVYS